MATSVTTITRRELFLWIAVIFSVVALIINLAQNHDIVTVTNALLVVLIFWLLSQVA